MRHLSGVRVLPKIMIRALPKWIVGRTWVTRLRIILQPLFKKRQHFCHREAQLYQEHTQRERQKIRYPHG